MKFEFWIPRRLYCVIATVIISLCDALDVDPNGYVVYCPCMGRFGNQADHFLGSLAFAHHLNRTLILPPWVEYTRDGRGMPNVEMQEFDKYFSIDALLEYHDVIVMRDFMKELAPTIWPEEKRFAFCWTPRRPPNGETCLDGGCCSQLSSPFGPFWKHSNINLVDSVYFSGEITSYDVHIDSVRRQWMESFPPSLYPVLAFTGAPADFPVAAHNRHLHKYLRWSDDVATKARAFLAQNVRPAGAAVIGVHFRNDLDWDNVCKLVDGGRSTHLFASMYCLGEKFENGQLTKEICAPSFDTIVKQLRAVVVDFEAKFVFVAADKSHMQKELQRALNDLKVKVIMRQPDEPHISLAILSAVDYYIGNCVSSFSNYAARERWTRDMKYGYWGVDDVQRGMLFEELNAVPKEKKMKKKPAKKEEL